MIKIINLIVFNVLKPLINSNLTVNKTKSINKYLQTTNKKIPKLNKSINLKWKFPCSWEPVATEKHTHLHFTHSFSLKQHSSQLLTQFCISFFHYIVFASLNVTQCEKKHSKFYGSKIKLGSKSFRPMP